MKKIISLIVAASVLLVSVVSCNIETSRSYSGDLTIKVTNLPDSVKALSFWGTPNEWKLDNIMADKDIYIADVDNGTAIFKLGTYTFSTILRCQFVPMTSRDMTMSDATWWQTAFSGSSEHANAENNLVYDFAKGASDPMTLTLDVTSYGIDLNNVFKTRFTTSNYADALKK